jgi:uncharacterized 2Fe-2S/4Fe-4S cluster protein (DUF4445 family)
VPLKACQIEFLPWVTQVCCPHGAVLIDVARDAGIALISVCGGIGSCGKCKVKIEKGTLLPPTSVEKQKLSDTEIASGYRLACQTRIQDNLTIYVPPLSILADQQLDLVCAEPLEFFDPVVQDIVVTLHPPTLTNQPSDW